MTRACAPGTPASLAATLVRGSDDLFAADLPRRLAYVLGAEGEGMGGALAGACDMKLSIPGSGRLETSTWRPRRGAAGTWASRHGD